MLNEIKYVEKDFPLIYMILTYKRIKKKGTMEVEKQPLLVIFGYGETGGWNAHPYY